MRYQYLILPLSLILLGCILLGDANSKVPCPKIDSLTGENIIISNNTVVVREDRLYLKYRSSFDSLQDTIRLNDHKTTQKMTIVISGIQSPLHLDGKQMAFLDKPESYMLDVGTERIRVMSRDDQGTLNGLSTLEALIGQHKGKLQKGWIIDYPDTKIRVLHLSLWPCTIQDFKDSIILARFHHYNTLILLNHYGVDLQSLQNLSIEGKPKWSTSEFQEMVKFAQENGMEVIPELKLLSHQEIFLHDSHPQYMYNKGTYDPRKKEVYEEIVFPAIDELLLLTGATKFHIGHDEVAGWHEYHYRKSILHEDEKQLPPDLFIQDVLTLYEYLKSKDVETWMWGDMLVSKDEFPLMKDSSANLNGYNGYAALRKKIPKEVVICAWHYRGSQNTFPTALAFAQDGHKVLGATWKLQETTKNFTKYMGQIPNNGAGMIATTWYGLSGDKKEQVKNIIRFSGEAFWNAKQQ